MRILTGSSFNPSAENTCPTKLTPGTQSFSFFRLNFNPTSLFLSSSSSQLLIRIRLIFTMYQEIIHYNLHRNPFKEFVHLPLVDFRGRRDAKREPCKSISTPRVLNVKSLELSSSTGSCQYPLQASRDMKLLATDSLLATSSTVTIGECVLLRTLFRYLGGQ